jgi:hypothetical protein
MIRLASNALSLRRKDARSQAEKKEEKGKMVKGEGAKREKGERVKRGRGEEG